jgi:hypothetical protein
VGIFQWISGVVPRRDSQSRPSPSDTASNHIHDDSLSGRGYVILAGLDVVAAPGRQDPGGGNGATEREGSENGACRKADVFGGLTSEEIERIHGAGQSSRDFSPSNIESAAIGMKV